jgi:hypothetical protein
MRKKQNLKNRVLRHLELQRHLKVIRAFLHRLFGQHFVLGVDFASAQNQRKTLIQNNTNQDHCHRESALKSKQKGEDITWPERHPTR